MRQYVSTAKDANGAPLGYSNDMYLEARPGLTAAPATTFATHGEPIP
jgi:hypothetical protein